MAESWIQVEEADTAIGVCLESYTGGNYPHRAYAILKRWYRHESARAPNPYCTDMEKVSRYLQTLNQREETHHPGLTLETHAELVQVNDKILSEVEKEAAVRRLRPYRAGGHTHLHAEHFRQWQMEYYPREY